MRLMQDEAGAQLDAQKKRECEHTELDKSKGRQTGGEEGRGTEEVTTQKRKRKRERERERVRYMGEITNDRRRDREPRN